MITRELTRQGVQVLNYIYNFESVAADEAAVHFHDLQALLARLSMQEAKHKSQPQSQVLNWLGLCFDTRAMTVSLTPLEAC